MTKALRDVADYKARNGYDMPSPSSITNIIFTGEISPGELAVTIPLLLDAGRTVKANLTFDAGLLADIDAAANQRGLTRSAFLASAAREKISAGR